MLYPFSLLSEDGGSLVFRNVGNISHNLEDHDMNLHLSENLKSRLLKMIQSWIFNDTFSAILVM
jgi:hypothetical protein